MKDKLIYIYPKNASFISNDLYFLKKKYKIITQDLDWGNFLKLPLNLVKQNIFLLFNVYKTKIILINFGGYFSLFPVLLGKIFNIKTFIILNGTDSVSFPNYNYGSLRKPILKFFIKKSYQYCTKLLPVDESLIFQLHNFDNNVVYKKQGVKAFFPNLTTSFQVIPNGFDTLFWQFSETVNRKGFLSVAVVNTMNTFRLKGLDLILTVAVYFPEEIFTIVGVSKKIIDKITIPKNVRIITYLKKEALKIEYQKHTYYIQVSLNEGFGCSLSEAMLCGCIPIISSVGALPNITDNIGFNIKKRSTKELFSVIKQAIHLSKNDKIILSKKAHRRIYNNYNISIREKLILQVLK